MIYIKYFIVILSLFFLNSCKQALTNLTPKTVDENPSNIYTLTLQVNPENKSWDRSTIRVTVTIDGESFAMKRQPIKGYHYAFDYTLPPNRSSAKYYFSTYYQNSKAYRLLENPGNLLRKESEKIKPQTERVEFSPLYDLKVSNRYIITLESKRGPVGSQIPVIGRGFNRSDQIVFDGDRIPTNYYSPNALSFTVPPKEANRSYTIYLESEYGNLSMDSFLVDPSVLQVLPNSLEYQTGEKGVIVFTIPFEAPSKGLSILVTTDIPKSIIMPEVLIPEGQRSTRVPIVADQAGTGYLYISALGFIEEKIPLTVKEKAVLVDLEN